MTSSDIILLLAGLKMYTGLRQVEIIIDCAINSMNDLKRLSQSALVLFFLIAKKCEIMKRQSDNATIDKQIY